MMDDNNSIIKSNEKIITFTNRLVERGIDLYDELRERTVVLTEDEISHFAKTYYETRNNIGNIPDELKLKTSNPNETKAFNVNNILAIFDKIRIRENFVLDYIYLSDHSGGEPRVYARNKRTPPIKTADEYYEKYSLERQNILLGPRPSITKYIPFLPYVEFENTPMGYFQFALFCMTIDNFYLFWHSLYGHKMFILTKKKLNEVIENKQSSLTKNELELLNTIDHNPIVNMNNNSAQVTLISYGINESISLEKICIRHPNIFIKHEKGETIIKGKNILF